MWRVPVVLLALLFVAFVARGDAGELPQLREEVRAILIERCGSCHDSTRSRENTDALEIFDLKDRDWPARMSNGQVRKLSSRIESFGGTVRERGRVRAFVDAELESRRDGEVRAAD